MGSTAASGAAAHTRVGDGTYVVGSDVPAGTYATQGGRLCYFTVLDSVRSHYSSARGSSTGPQHATLRAGNLLQLSGGCTWTRTG